MEAKTGEDRRVELCPRAIVILESHLAWRASLVRQGHIDHDALFFTHDFQPIPDAKYPFERWHKTLDQTDTVFPGSRLRVRFAVRPPACIGLAFPGTPPHRSSSSAAARAP